MPETRTTYTCATCSDAHRIVREGGDYRDPGDTQECPDCPLNTIGAAHLENRVKAAMRRAGWALGRVALGNGDEPRETLSRHEFYQLALAKGYVTGLECQKLAAYWGNDGWFGSLD